MFNGNIPNARTTTFRRSNPHVNRQVFQTNPPRNVPTLLDVKDALDATRSMHLRDRREYFYGIGIDYSRACEYFDVVCMLERCHNKTRILEELRERLRVLQAAISLLFTLLKQP